MSSKIFIVIDNFHQLKIVNESISGLIEVKGNSIWHLSQYGKLKSSLTAYTAQIPLIIV